MPGYFDLLSNPKVLDVVESLIGPEIFANPVYNVRPKVPLVAAGEVPWHQDKSYWPGARSNPVITVWVALVDATIENGCLRVIPRTQHEGVGGFHFETYSGTAYRELDEENVGHLRGRAQPLPVNAGSAILFNDRFIHSSGPNLSTHVRWSVDLRYQPADQDPMPQHGVGFLARSRAPRPGGDPGGLASRAHGGPRALVRAQLRSSVSARASRATRRASRNGTGARAASVEAARTISAAVAASVRQPACATTGLVPLRVQIQRATSSPASTSGVVAPRARTGCVPSA